jgi:hypothetical protein
LIPLDAGDTCRSLQIPARRGEDPCRRSLTLANPLMSFAQDTDRDDVLVRGDGRRGAGFEASAPQPHHARLDIELA